MPCVVVLFHCVSDLDLMSEGANCLFGFGSWRWMKFSFDFLIPIFTGKFTFAHRQNLNVSAGLIPSFLAGLSH